MIINTFRSINGVYTYVCEQEIDVDMDASIYDFLDQRANFESGCIHEQRLVCFDCDCFAEADYCKLLPAYYFAILRDNEILYHRGFDGEQSNAPKDLSIRSLGLEHIDLLIDRY